MRENSISDLINTVFIADYKMKFKQSKSHIEKEYCQKSDLYQSSE